MKTSSGKFTCFFFLLISVIYSTGSIFYLFPHGVKGEWCWDYVPFALSVNLLFPLVSGGLVLLLFHFVSKKKISVRLFLVASVILSFLFVLSFCYLYPSRLTHFVATNFEEHTTGHLVASLKFPDVRSIFSENYTAMMPHLPTHSHTHLPGPVLCYKLTTVFFYNHPSFSSLYSKIISAMGFDGNALRKFVLADEFIVNTAFSMGISVLFFLSLSVIPVFLLARELFDEETALYALPLWIFVPAVVSFFPQIDLMYPPISTAAVLFLVKYLNTQKGLYMMLCSVTLALGIFFSFAFTTLILLCAMIFVLHVLQKRLLREFIFLAKSSVLFLAPFFVFYLCLYIFGRISVIDAFNVAMKINSTVESHLSRLRWALFYTWYDYFSFAGLASSMLFLHSLYSAAKDSFGGKTRPYAYVLFSYSIVFSCLVFSGIVIAEVSRIWIFLMPFLVIFAANGMKLLSDKKHGTALLLLSSAFLQAVVFKMTYNVMFELRAGFDSLKGF